MTEPYITKILTYPGAAFKDLCKWVANKYGQVAWWFGWWWKGLWRSMNEFLYGKYRQILTWIGDVMVATRPPSCHAEQILAMLPFLERGNVICRYYSYYLDSVFIPGEFTHSGIIVDKRIIIPTGRFGMAPVTFTESIIHSIAEGVQEVHPVDFVKDTDGFVILKPSYPDEAALNRAVERAYWHLRNKSSYDFLFNDPNKWYCHEFTVDCLEMGGIKDIPLTHKSFGVWPFKFGRDLYLADDIIRHCKTEYVFRGRHRRGIATEAAANVAKLGRVLTLQKRMAG